MEEDCLGSRSSLVYEGEKQKRVRIYWHEQRKRHRVAWYNLASYYLQTTDWVGGWLDV